MKKNLMATFIQGSEASPCSFHGLCMDNDTIRLVITLQTYIGTVVHTVGTLNLQGFIYRFCMPLKDMEQHNTSMPRVTQIYCIPSNIRLKAKIIKD